MYTHELRAAVVDWLQSQPEVRRVNHLEYWGEEIFFTVLEPRSPELEQRLDREVGGLVQRLHPLGGTRVRLRYFSAGQMLPSSATLYVAPATAVAGGGAP